MVTVDFDLNWPRAGWLGFGVVLAVAVLYVVHSFVGTFVFGVFIYYATRRLYRRVRRRVGPPSVAAAISLLLLALPGIALLYYTLAIGLQQFTDFARDVNVENGQFGAFVERIQPYVEVSRIVDDPTTLIDSAGGLGAVTGTLTDAMAYLGLLLNGLLHLFVMFALAFYLLRDGSRMAQWMGTFTDAYGVLDHYFAEVDRSLDKVFYGNILNALITGTIGAIAFSLLNVLPAPLEIPYAALMGLLAGVASLIPIVGMKLVYVPLTLYLAVLAVQTGDGWWFVGLFAGVAFLVVDTIPDLVVRPYVSGGSLHVGALMFAYILGPLLWGWYGIFLGPILLVLVVHFVRIVLPELVAGTPIQPYSVDPGAAVDRSPFTPDPATESGGVEGADSADEDGVTGEDPTDENGPAGGESTDGDVTDGTS